MLKKSIKILDMITEASVCFLIFIIPFSKAGIEIFATIAIAGWAITQLLRRLSISTSGKQACLQISQTPLTLPIFVFFITSFISTIFSTNINLSLAGLFLKLGEYILLFIICADVFSKKENNDIRFKVLYVVITISAILLFADAGFQWITGKDFIRGFRTERLRACFSNSNDFAGYIITVLPILFCIVFIEISNVRASLNSIIRFGSLVLFLAGFVLLSKTLARGAWMGFLASTSFLVAMGLVIKKKGFGINDRRKNMKLFVLLAIVCICIPLIAIKPAKERLVSIKQGFGASASRFYQWKEAISIIMDFPIFGTGPNTYTRVVLNYSISKITGSYPHNSYLHMAAETGILGLSAFLWVIWRFFKIGISLIWHIEPAYYKNQFLPFFLICIMTGILAFLTQSLFDTNLFALKLATLFWTMLGVGTGIALSMK